MMSRNKEKIELIAVGVLLRLYIRGRWDLCFRQVRLCWGIGPGGD